MKACVIQTKYSLDFSKSEEYFQETLNIMNACDESMDLIVMPEYSDLPCLTSSREEMMISYGRFNKKLLEHAAKTAKRCKAVLFVNALYDAGDGLRNTTHAFNSEGKVVGRYYKQHPVNDEVFNRKLDCDYSYGFSEPTVLEIDGIRYGFLTCYDFYFYESFANIARQNVDIIIGCSHQRSDLHSALEMMSRFCAYNCNAYVIRSSISMGEASEVGGSSMIVSPNGTVIADMVNDVGMAIAEIDPHEKYYKPAGFGNPPSAHYEYIEIGRRPWKYRPAGSAIVKGETLMSYPRVCAHRGFNTIAPENSMPALGAAIALGAEEIEFDLWVTKDGEIVSCHDESLERLSNGTGKIYEYTLEELQKLDFGSQYGEHFRGLSITLFEDILKKYACHVIMNIHIKTKSENYDAVAMKKIIGYIRKYDCEKHVYFMISHDGVIKQFQEYASDIPICVGYNPNYASDSVDRAIRLNAKKVQLFKPYFNQEMIDKAHDNGIRCNVFWSDDPEETMKFLDMGIDTILTNDYHVISQVVKNYELNEL